MTTSILLRSPSHPSPSPSSSPASTPLPALQTDLSSSSSSSTSGSCLDLHRTSSAPPTRRIRFAPLPDPRRDFFDTDTSFDDDPQSHTKSPQHTVPPHGLPDGSVALSPSVSPDSTHSSARSTPTIRTSANVPLKNTQKLNSKFLRPFSFLRRANSSSPNRSPLSQSASLPGSRDPSPSPLARSASSVPNSPSFHSARLPRISTEDILTLGAKSFFRARSGSPSITRLPRTSTPPPNPLHSTQSLHRSASTGSGPGMNLDNGKRDWGENSTRSHDTAPIAGSGPKKRRASSSALSPGAGGGRHASSVKMLPGDSTGRPNTAPSSSVAPPKKRVKMLNGRIYGSKRYTAQTLANPFANVRDDPEFVEWGYGGMGSVHASAGIANDMWKGLQRSERGGALLAGSSFASPSASTHAGAVTTGGGRGSGARANSPIARRKMSDNVPECGMGNVAAGAPLGDDDGSGMGWVRRRRAEREAKARLEQESQELQKMAQEGRKSGDSIDASMYASTASTTTSLTACTSTASTVLTTPTTSPLASRSPSVTDLKLTSPPFSESHDLDAVSPRIATDDQSDIPAHPAPASKDEHEHHVLRAVRLSPNISSPSHKHSHPVTHDRTPLSHTLSQIGKDADGEGTELMPPLSPVDTEETTTSTNSSGEEEPTHSSDEEEEQDDLDDDEDEAQDIRRKTALGAGVEKISRHVDVEAR